MNIIRKRNLVIKEKRSKLFLMKLMEIPNISTSYEKNPDAIYTSRIFIFSNLPKPVNSSIITSYIDEDNEDDQDSKLLIFN
ncbi:unnamed protein product [Rhizophagus irregularis]|nr:unnamed protein product [Rhizophagus irregularis]